MSWWLGRTAGIGAHGLVAAPGGGSSAVLCHYATDDLLQPIQYRPYRHLPAPLGVADDVVDHHMEGVSFMGIVHVDSPLFFNSGRTSEGPFIPRLKTGG